MKRYWLFSGDHYYPLGGLQDFKGDFDSFEATYVHFAMLEEKPDWAQILDTETRQIEKLIGYESGDKEEFERFFKVDADALIETEIFVSHIAPYQQPSEETPRLPSEEWNMNFTPTMVEDQKTIDGIRNHPTPKQIEFIPINRYCPCCQTDTSVAAQEYNGEPSRIYQYLNCPNCSAKLESRLK